MSNIINLKIYRESKADAQLAYEARVLSMNKIELLEEMVRYQEERTALGKLTLTMILKGLVLFKELEKNSETNEMKILTRSYRRHLEYELEVVKHA